MLRSTRTGPFRALLLLALLAPLAAARPAPVARPAAPAAPRAAPAVLDLQHELQRLLRAAGAPSVRYGVLVLSLDRGDTLFALNPDALLAPASNMKLYSTAAALYYLGPAFRYTSYLLADGEVRGGTLQGDLVLFGTGDPSLGSARLPGTRHALNALADSLARRGVREVSGDVVADAGYFDAQGFGPGWLAEDRSAWYGAPVTALAFAENLVGGARPAGDPVARTAAALRQALRERGIRVQGRARARYGAGAGSPFGAPRTHLLASHLSPPLAELARETNHVSHNLFAEALFKTLGRVVDGEGSFDGGSRALGSFLRGAAGIDPAGLHLADGSGLSRANRVTARSTVRLLEAMTRTDVWPAFRASLPEAGHPRGAGLARMYGTPAAANLRAKTGTLRNVSALSGYVSAANGERLAFSIIANGTPSTTAAKRTEDAIGARLAAWRR